MFYTTSNEFSRSIRKSVGINSKYGLNNILMKLILLLTSHLLHENIKGCITILTYLPSILL
ncbi:hypothetical protein Hanom_Chr07g00620821 [Helianthus anomalus]